ncbi:relaxase/mobilization nuclease domain-containing protein [Erythrobacter sp. MTPC3]|uniref:relaxase/mobilization nuclease domain-containing protein n=1 Tax=Erythrobacter sp. MTPC3 TaxID=3056564 RepID=UPI0036F36677
MADGDFDIRPGRSRDSGAGSYRKANTLVGRVLQVSRRAGYTPLGRRRSGGGTGHLGRGKRAALQRRRSAFQRRVVIKARVVRHRGTSFRSAPLARHIAYLERDGVTRDGSDGEMFDAGSDRADGEAFAERCEDDRHHFRFIVSPEDASEMADLRAFTREMMDDMASDLDTQLDWVAVDHWNTDNPHIHVLVRGVASDGKDLVIDRAYISEGLRARAEERVTVELGPRSERDIQNSLRREVDAERWTSLDRRLQRQRDDLGVVDLRPEGAGTRKDRSLLLGRAQTLERMGLAERVGPASWTLAADAEPTLRELGDRGDIIKTMHRAMTGHGLTIDPERIALHGRTGGERVIGRLVERGLHDELTGEAYAIIDGTDGRTHHLRFPDIDQTTDAAPGAIVQASSWTDRKGRQQASLLVRSDLSIEAQIRARGATWLDRQLVSPRPETLSGGFGSEVRDALEQRSEGLIDEGLANRQGQRIVFARGLLDTLRDRELADAGKALTARHGGIAQPVSAGDHVAGTYRERVTLASGRFAMIDNGMGFQLVPWRQDMDRHLGQAVAGRINPRGGVDWSFARSRGPAI